MMMEICPGSYSIYKLGRRALERHTLAVPEKGLFFFARTEEERSLVCLTEYVSADCTAREDGWRAMRVAGALDFSLTGILSRIAGALARRKISIFAVSTYDTDYILVKEAMLDAAVAALIEEGYRFS